MRYAEKTSVNVGKTKQDIEKVLNKYGTTDFAYMSGVGNAMVGFIFKGITYKLSLFLPDPASTEFTHTSQGRERKTEAIMKSWEQACRSRWRALYLLIKATLEAVEIGVVTFEEAFMSHTLLPDGSTIGQKMVPMLEAAVKKGVLPKLLT